MSGTGDYIFYHGGTASTVSGISFSPNITVNAETRLDLKVEDKSISPSLYIKFVKSKLKEQHKIKFERRMKKLQKLVPYAKDMGQTAFYEELTRELAIMIKESEIEAIGIKKFVTQDDIDKFRHNVKDKVIKLKKLEEFPRVIPAKVRKKLKEVQATKVFAEFCVLFIDYTGEEIKTNSEKIREKDPILFGKIKEAPHKFFYIADWVDEYCDLTLEKFVESFDDADEEFDLGAIQPLTKDNYQSR